MNLYLILVSVSKWKFQHWPISPRFSQFSAFQLTFFDKSELLLSKWKFYQLSSDVIAKYDLVPDCWLIQHFDIFPMILTCRRCETSTNSWCAKNLRSNHVLQWDSKTIGEISILKAAILRSQKRKLKSAELWKSWWNWS